MIIKTLYHGNLTCVLFFEAPSQGWSLYKSLKVTKNGTLRDVNQLRLDCTLFI